MNAFTRDFEVNGPSLARLIRVLLTGWQKYKHHPNSRIRKRFDWEVDSLRSTYAGAVWAMRKKYRNDRLLAPQLSALLNDIYREFGWKTRLIAPVVGRYLLVTIKLEERRLAKGWTLEPECFYEQNRAALKLDEKPQTKYALTPEEIQGAGRAPSPVVLLDGQA